MAGSDPQIVRVDPQQMRALFNDGRYWERQQAGEFTVHCIREGHPAPEKSGQPYCTRSQMISYRNADGLEIARVHQYLRPDQTLGGSGKPDPKRLLDGATLYRLVRGG